MIIPYLFIVISIATIASLRHFIHTHEVNFFLGTLYECSTPAWFLLALFGAKVLFNIIYKYAERHYLAVAFVLSSIPCFLVYGMEVNPILSIGSSFCSVFFYAVGYFAKVNDILCKLKALSPYSVVVAFVLWLNTSLFGKVDLHYCIFYLWVIDFLGACSGVYLCYLISSFIDKRTVKPKEILTKMGYSSFVIYSFHAIEYVFPEWHQIASFSDGTVLRPYIILAFRLIIACVAVLMANRITLLKNLFFPVFEKKQ